MSVPQLFVVGGNGFLGSAICRTAVARGWDVSSMSSTGRPYETPAGHTPKWVHKVKWHSGSAFEPDQFSDIIKSSTAVVHTLGILLEDSGYKSAVKNGDVFGIAKSLAGSLGGNGNPLKTTIEHRKGYDGMNRDSALTVLDTYRKSIQPEVEEDRPFVYISAADAFRPVVPNRYIESKREAEYAIARTVAGDPSSSIRPIFIRPGLMYHPHIRPISTLPAFLLSLTASLPLPNPFASKSWLHGALESFSTHPIHVDHVASAVIRSIEDPEMRGVVDVDTMRHWAGFKADKRHTSHQGALS